MALGTILCVDDDATVLRALRTILNKSLGSDFTIEVAQGAQEGLEIVEELAESGRDLNLVISDYIMPGMRGDEFLIQLHACSPSTVKVMLTGQSDLEGVKRTVNNANLYRFLEKPFNNADFVLTVKSALRIFALERELRQDREELRLRNAELERTVDQLRSELVALKTRYGAS